jgi:hypothetical protein
MTTTDPLAGPFPTSLQLTQCTTDREFAIPVDLPGHDDEEG